MHDLMERFGYVDRAIVPVLAEALNLSRAEIHGTLTFYHDFRDHPPGRTTLKVCRAEACQSRGSRSRCTTPCAASSASTGTAPRRTAPSPSSRCSAWASAPARRPCWSTRSRSATSASRRSMRLIAEAQGMIIGLRPHRRRGDRGWRRQGRAKALAAKAGDGITIKRNGSRGMQWLEPMVEVVTPPRAASPTARSKSRTSTACSPPAFAPWRRPCAAPRQARGDGLAEEADPPHLRARRRHRPARHRRLSRPRRLRRPAERHRDDRRGHLQGRHRQRPARARRRRLPDRHQVDHGPQGARPSDRPSRSTSSATPTRATAAPSPTA